MVNNRQKMHRSNSAIKIKLKLMGYVDLYVIPHMRFSKDYHFAECEFDAIGWKRGEMFMTLFQFKTNTKPSKKDLEKYKKIFQDRGVKCLWASKFDRKGVVIYGE